MVMTPGQGRCHPGIESTALIVSGCSSKQGDPGLPALQGMLLDRPPGSLRTCKVSPVSWPDEESSPEPLHPQF